MKNLVYGILLLMGTEAYAQNRVVSGTVQNADTEEPLQYATVFLLHSGVLAITDVEGKFKLNIADSGANLMLVVSYIGFKNDTIWITLTKGNYKILLEPTEKALREVVVTGVSRATQVKENPVPITTISPKAIEQTIESNIIDVLGKNAPGLNAVKTGPNISKPFIRGLGYNRVLTLVDGVRQEGQQWGDEHGIEVDAYNIEKAEVLKGPASLMYGSDAIAGVVGLISAIPHEQDGKFHNKFLSEYQSNNGLIGNGLRITYGDNHWSFALRGSYRIAKNYKNSIDGSVYNTGFRETNVSAFGAYRSKNGYSNLSFSLYDNLQGIPDGSRDSLSRKFTKQVYENPLDDVKKRPIVSDADLNSYQMSPLHQHIEHHRIYSINHYQLGKGEVDILLAFQQNIRREFDHPTKPLQAGLFVRLNTIDYGFRYDMPVSNDIEVSMGVNGMYQFNKNKDATDFPIPDYHLFDAGAYACAKWKYKKWTASGGLRYDVRFLSGENFYTRINANTGFNMQVFSPDTAGAFLQFPSFRKAFSGLSLSAGITFQFTRHIAIKANIARGYRAPNITEFASNGLDPGAHIVYLGNRDFVPEFSLQEDVGISGDFNNMSVTISTFNNNIQHYIYLAQLTNASGAPVVAVPGNKTYQYQQSSAQLYGLEVSIELRPKAVKGLRFNNTFSMIYGFNRKAEFKNEGVYGEFLPLIPPFKLLSSISQSFKTKSTHFPVFSLKIEADCNAAQTRYLASDHTETATHAYALLNIAAGTEIVLLKKSTLQIQVQINNLLDMAYQSNLSRLKYFEYYSQSHNGHPGIYGMGRNFCIKLVLPF